MKYIHTAADFSPVEQPSQKRKVRVYFDLEGVLMNFTRDAARALDNMQIPVMTDGIFHPNPIYTRTTKEIMFDICHGFDFYAEMEKYMWSDIVFQEVFMAANENVYFIARQSTWDRESWGGKAQWLWKNFGQYGYDHLIMVSDQHELSRRLSLTKSDILIDDFLEPNIKHWCLNGGTGFWWAEIDPRADEKVITKELWRRIAALKLLIANAG